jgi:hypothetical protein
MIFIITRSWYLAIGTFPLLQVVPNMVFASIAAATAMATVGGRSLLTGQSRRQDAISGGLIIIKKNTWIFF